MWIQTRLVSPPNFQEWRLPLREKVSARCRRRSRVWRGRMEARAKAINDIIDSRLRLEGIGRGFLAVSGELQAQVTGGAKSRALVSDSTALSVATRSSPFSLMAKLVTGLAGSKKTLFSPE